MEILDRIVKQGSCVILLSILIYENITHNSFYDNSINPL